MALLQIENLNFAYPETEKNALTQVHLSVQEGEFVVICGASGCGKSTLLRMLKRELTPYGTQTGEIWYRGIPLAQLDERTAAAEIGFVMQDPDSQIVTDAVWHELAFGLESLGQPTATIRRRVAEMASYFGIEDWFHKNTNALSGGQKQLLNLASVMTMQPKLLLLDEPTAQLDPIAASNFIATLQKINRELGLTILLVEHRLEEVFPIADRVWLIDEGRAVFDGAPHKIGQYLKKYPTHALHAGLPTAMRVYNALEETGDAPLTVREGRKYITETYENTTDEMHVQAYVPPKEKAVELKDVWFRYERDLPDVLRGCSLSIFRGEHFCVLGGNGTGKSTMLSVIAGVRRAYRGNIQINGKKLQSFTENTLYTQNLALLPQNPQTVFLEKTVQADLTEVCKSMHYNAQESTKVVLEVAEKLQITHLLQQHPYDLSGGEQQKAALAKMLLLKPRILLLDEPTKGLDAAAKRNLATLIRMLQADGVTVITVTHDVEFAAENADRCALFFDGAPVSVEEPIAFFAENHFYTTAAGRMTRGYFKNTVRCSEVIALCRLNGKKGGNDIA